MLKKKTWIVCLMLLFIATCVVGGCGGNNATTPEPAPEAAAELEGTVVIYHAGSLSIPFAALEKEFETLHPKVDIQRTEGGSTKLIRQIVDLGDKVDIFASADYMPLEQELMPDYASWDALFANNSMVIMYTDQSKYANEITKDNWYEILLKDGVNYGHSNPNDDPCGYRSILSWKLAELKYEKEGLYQQLRDNCPEKNIRPKSVELISLLETGTLDYAFEYESVARQHAAANKAFKWVELPKKVNLSDLENAEYYAQVSMETSGATPEDTKTVVGEPIVYGLTMPNSGVNTELAVEFLKFFFDKEQGLKILEDNGQPVLKPIIINGEGFPEDLNALIK